MTNYIEEKVDKVMEVLEKHTKLRQRDMETFKRWLTTSYSEVDRRARESVAQELRPIRDEIESIEGRHSADQLTEYIQELTNLTPNQ